MRQVSRILAVLVVLVLAGAVGPHAGPNSYGVNGYVYCDVTQPGVIDAGDKPLANVTVFVTKDGTTIASTVTDVDGYFSIFPLLGDSYVLNIVLPAGATGVLPGVSVPFTLSADNPVFTQDFLITDPACIEKFCWMTGGGQKIEIITGLRLAERGAKHSFGGNVYPSCSPDPGDGGSWNHVAHAAKLHFHGQQITVVRCGNVAGIPPGSTSPVTPYNFIEFTGTGTLVGIKGNKANYGTVYFFARVEDRNEPGNEGALGTGGELIDRYFIRVYTNPADIMGSTVLLLDGDGDPTTVDPVPITHGNLQLHISSCS